eukprot:SAG31_NODE_840_length_11596_cov_3.056623_7_plen_135_part_00
MLELENQRVKAPVLRPIARRVMVMRWTAGGPIFWYARFDCKLLFCCRSCLFLRGVCRVTSPDKLSMLNCFVNCGARSIVRAGAEVIVRQGPYSGPTLTDSDIRSAIVASPEKSEFSTASEAQVCTNTIGAGAVQ